VVENIYKLALRNWLRVIGVRGREEDFLSTVGSMLSESFLLLLLSVGLLDEKVNSHVDLGGEALQ
jgi:hypothetical protein